MQEWQKSIMDDYPRMAGRIAELEDLLEELFDLQEGPPLIKYADEWNAVMIRCAEVLNREEDHEN